MKESQSITNNLLMEVDVLTNRIRNKRQSFKTTNNKALREIGFDKDVKKLVLHQVKLANKAKLDAIVCSAQEVKLVKKFFKKEIITPGIRFTSKKNDQKRVLTPNEAYSNGADWLVIGRDLTRGNIKKNTQILIDHLSK